MATSDFIIKIENSILVTLDNGASMPVKAYENDAGYDLRCVEGGTIPAREARIFDTGVHIDIPRGFVGYVQGRSGLNFNQNVFCPTGTVDSGYTGSIKVKLYNFNDCDYVVNSDDKIAQLVIQPIAVTWLYVVETLGWTDRGNNGFGSTGR